MSKAKKGSNDNVKVMVRVRPFNSKEIAENGGEIPFCTVMAREGVVQTTDPFAPEESNLNSRQEFAFDYVFWSIPSNQLEADVPFASQEDVFAHAGMPALDNLFDGFNGCIFAYGQTSSGKTHTMMGYTPPESQRGLIPRLCELMFDRIAEAEEACKNLAMTTGKVRKVEHSVTLSYLEIYNEKVLDLLTPKGKNDEELRVQYDPITGPMVKGLKVVEVTDWPEVKRQFKIGTDHRTTAATAMNLVSSRSHAVVQLTLMQREIVALIKGKPKEVVRQSRINLVDLAGSEKVAKSMVTGQNLKEAIGINQSLTCLGRVIDGLVKGEKHVPYRDSVLTQLLSDSLGGNSRTTMLAAISPAAVNFEETVSTLRYASRARQIINVVKVNEDPTATLIRELQEELAALRVAMLEAADTEGGEGVTREGRRLSTGRSPEAKKRSKEEADARAAEAQALEHMLEQLQVRDANAARKLEAQEAQWARERARIERGHKMAITQLETEREELMREQQELLARTEQLESTLAQEQAERDWMQQKHESAQAASAAQQSELRRQRVIDRFRLASDKTRLQMQKQEANKELADLQLRAQQLALEVEERDRELAERPLKFHGMYLGQRANLDGGAVLCDMCTECHAIRWCAGCGGDHLCELCDFNQHRSSQTCFHQRINLPAAISDGVILCEFCGVKRAVFTCHECINGCLCEDCNDVKHRNKKRNFHRRTPGVVVTANPRESPPGRISPQSVHRDQPSYLHAPEDPHHHHISPQSVHRGQPSYLQAPEVPHHHYGQAPMLHSASPTPRSPIGLPGPQLLEYPSAIQHPSVSLQRPRSTSPYPVLSLEQRSSPYDNHQLRSYPNSGAPTIY